MADKRYQFQATDAVFQSILLRAAFCGPTGSGKTTTALILATRMVERMGLGPIYVIDSEHKSALKYAFRPNSGKGYRFKHVPMPEDDYSPEAYTAALDYCEDQGAGVIIVDSFSHLWNGINGVLELVDQVTEKSRTKNGFSEGWKDLTPRYNRVVERLMSCGAHLIFTMRSQTEWVIQENERGKKEPVKLGTKPVMRDGMDYEPDLFFDMTVPDNSAYVGKTRCDKFAPGDRIKKPGIDFADLIIEWLTDAEPAAGARTLGEAITIAVAEGSAAAEAEDPAAYQAARAKLTAWCKSNGVGEQRHEIAQSQTRDRIAGSMGHGALAAVAGGATPATPRRETSDGRATAADIKRRLDAAEGEESIERTAKEIDDLPEVLRGSLRVTAMKRRIALAGTAERLDELADAVVRAHFEQRGHDFLVNEIAKRRDVLGATNAAPAA